MARASQKSADVVAIIPADLLPVVEGLKTLAASLVKMPEIDVIPATIAILGDKVMPKAVADYVMATIIPKGQTIVAGRVKAMRAALLLGATGYALAEKAASEAAKENPTLATTEKVVIGQFARKLAEMDPTAREAAVPTLKVTLADGWTFRTTEEAHREARAKWLNDGQKLGENNSDLSEAGRNAFKELVAKFHKLK